MDIVEFLTSKEIIVVYIVAAVACLLCFIIYLVEKHNDRGRKRHNTRELNKLVEQIKDEIEPIEEVSDPILQPIVEDTTTLDIINQIGEEVLSQMNTPVIVNSEVVEDDLEYTSIEPDVDTAKEQLQKITLELKNEEEKKEEVIENISLTAYEEEQEENAIISLDELVKKGKEIYESNETVQYNDERTVPISITELEKTVGRETEKITEPFIISSVVAENIDDEKVSIDDFNTIKTSSVTDGKKFKNSPIISPIYGIEKMEVNNELELENTADYDKLDAEIKKTNEFLMTLKELQNKLD